ncbi:hypothetical protein AB5J62_12905 [Amycolatopsis sp. cg5]|uniref:hypothetical protein n=1 Tax=Amycolatopsis sp. cg5 TaxID=3238802 RepID=UPI0035238628
MTQAYAPENAAGLTELVRAELGREPLPDSAGHWPQPGLGGTGDVELISGRLTAAALAWLLDAAEPASGILRFTLAARYVDGLAVGWYEFREGAFYAVESADPLPVDPATVFVASDRKALREGGVHRWRQALLATGAAGEVARSHASVAGYSFALADSSTANEHELFVQAWTFAPDGGC